MISAHSIARARHSTAAKYSQGSILRPAFKPLRNCARCFRQMERWRKWPCAGSSCSRLSPVPYREPSTRPRRKTISVPPTCRRFQIPPWRISERFTIATFSRKCNSSGRFIRLNRPEGVILRLTKDFFEEPASIAQTFGRLSLEQPGCHISIISSMQVMSK